MGKLLLSVWLIVAMNLTNEAPRARNIIIGKIQIPNESEIKLKKKNDALRIADENIKAVKKQVYLLKLKSDKKQLYNAYKNLLFIDEVKNRILYADSLISVSTAANDIELIGAAYLTRGILKYDLKNLQEAVNDFVIADQYISQQDSKYNSYKLKYALAHTKYYLGYYNEAIALLNQCEIYFSEENERGYLNTLHALARCYTKKNEIIKSNYYNGLGLKESLDFENDKMVVYFKQATATNLYFSKEYSQAIENMKKVIPILRQNKDFANEALANFYIGKSFWELGNQNAAVQFFTKVDQAFDSNDYLQPEFRENYELLIKFYENRNPKLFLKYVKKLMVIEKILTSKYAYLSTKIHREYDMKKLITAQNKMEEELNNKNNKSYAVALIAVMIAMFFWGRSFYLKKKYLKRFNHIMMLDNQTVFKSFSTNPETEELEINNEIVQMVLKNLDKFEKNKMFLEADLTLSRMSVLLNINGKYASKIIYKYRGKKIVNYINDLKINHLIFLLKSDKKYRLYNYQALSKEIGFGSTQNFIRAFKNHTDLSPLYFINKLNERE